MCVLCFIYVFFLFFFSKAVLLAHFFSLDTITEPLTLPDRLSAFHLVAGFFTQRQQLKIELKSPVKSLTASFVMGEEKCWL